MIQHVQHHNPCLGTLQQLHILLGATLLNAAGGCFKTVYCFVLIYPREHPTSLLALDTAAGAAHSRTHGTLWLLA